MNRYGTVGDNTIRHYHPIEMNNEQRLEVSELMASLKEVGFINGNINLGQFVSICFIRGLNEYRKELFRRD